jgi:hypothetical protein
MDETPEELAQIVRDAERIDVNKYRRRYRLTVGVLIVGFCIATTWVAVRLARESRNPCERVRDYYCRKAPDRLKCDSYQGVLKESVEDSSPRMRSLIRDQCLTKITRLHEEDGIAIE